MIKPQDKMFANLTHQLQRDLPLEPLTRLVNLAAIALGVLRSKSLQVGQILTVLPLAGTRDTLKKRVQRFLKNPASRSSCTMSRWPGGSCSGWLAAAPGFI